MSDQRRLTGDEWNDLILERDTFKLAIRGQTGIEAEIDAAVADAFVGPMPRELQPRSVRFELRLAMAVGLGVIPPDWQPMFAALATLRNDFAHGKIRELDAARARNLFDATQASIGPVQPDDLVDRLIEQERNGSPHNVLAFALLTARFLLVGAAQAAKERREEEARIVAQHRLSAAGLSPLVQALLSKPSDAPTPEG